MSNYASTWSWLGWYGGVTMVVHIQGLANIVVLENLRNARERRAMSQLELAERAGVARQTLIRLERGRPATPETHRKLAEALGLQPGQLIDGKSS
jgi:DNA-binding XRE family transcriptional regulator